MTRPDREGKKGVLTYVSLEEWKTLRHLATETERSADDLMREALTLLIDKHHPQTQPTRNGKKTPHPTKSARELRHD
jgi:hypothetical protein